jgi:TldD protein
MRMLENAARVGEEAVQLLAAPQCPAGEKDLILGSSQLGLQIHESCGHPIELDRVLGYEANYAGTSFLTLDKLGAGFKYGSPAVNIVADAFAPGGLGTFGFDDEGVPAQRWDIVREGTFKGYLTSRETAGAVGLERSQGTMRASGYNRIPLIRMTNVSLEPGEGSLEELIADTKDGVFMDTNRSWSIDQRRYNFQFVCEAGWEVKDGKRVRLVKNPSYQGITPEFWGSCDRVCGLAEWVLWGVPNCGKGEPGQSMGTGHGAAPARFRKVKIGAAYADR